MEKVIFEKSVKSCLVSKERQSQILEYILFFFLLFHF